MAATAVRRRLASASLSSDVVLELLDDELLLGDGGLDQVADRDETHQLAIVHHWQVPQPVLCHQHHVLVARLAGVLTASSIYATHPGTGLLIGRAEGSSTATAI